MGTGTIEGTHKIKDSDKLTSQQNGKILKSFSETTSTENSKNDITSRQLEFNIITPGGDHSFDGYIDRATKEMGEEAQEWLRKEIKLLLAQLAKQWSFSPRPERDKEGKETDIVLRKDNQEFHIEVKHTKNDEIFWSVLEVKKAKELKERNIPYVIAVLTQLNGETEDYYIKWFWDPLEELKMCWSNNQVSGKWIWKKTEQNIGSEIFNNLKPWNIPEKPRIEPTYFWYHIDLKKVIYSSEGIDALEEQLKRLSY